MTRSFGLAIVLLIASGAGAMAQSQDQFVSAFSGQWQVYDARLSSGAGLCQLNLSALGGTAHLPLDNIGCSAPLAKATAWSIEGNQLVLYGSDDSEVARLGGNQKRITGTDNAGVPLILERVGGDGVAATLQAAYNASGCYYLGYSQNCATKADLGLPIPAADGKIQVLLEVNLNAHSEARADADTIGTIQQGTCVAVDVCTMASDGPWCRATFGGATGWLRKLTLRANRWPVATFGNQCTP